MMTALVSVIIPCYNAERWIREAIDSCRNQTHKNLEIIVIDDGSSDGTLDILKSYGSTIKLESRPRLGGNNARNRGFALSNGEYIQYLDADDYLLPEKIAKQLTFLSQTGADVVYGDWKHRFHRTNGESWLGEIVRSGKQSDILAALLSGWWVAMLALLFRRTVVEKVGGWDESLKAAQDTDFFISVARVTTNVIYQPGCDSIYRRPNDITVSTDRQRKLENLQRVFDKAVAALISQNRLMTQYRRAVARSYFALARNCYDLDRDHYHDLMIKVLTFDPGFKPTESRLYNMTQRLLGYQLAEAFASAKRRAWPM
jgi:glycosyltransferase involved in cell wall biosynthesis